jgi:hypothetical protein
VVRGRDGGARARTTDIPFSDKFDPELSMRIDAETAAAEAEAEQLDMAAGA